ncbi:hypothetical protein [Sorangium sp. So ce128]|uniref:hypothetical protein n=1 Tax=Sorangium sp. So ce128 TaxID=3133281 RepID=UPI003F5F2EEB
MQPDLLSSTPARATARASAPPSARGFPLVGVLPHLLKDRLDYLVSAREQLGDLYTIDLGLARIVALNHPRHAQHVLRDNARNYRKGGAIWAGRTRRRQYDVFGRLTGIASPAARRCDGATTTGHSSPSPSTRMARARSSAKGSAERSSRSTRQAA